MILFQNRFVCCFFVVVFLVTAMPCFVLKAQGEGSLLFYSDAFATRGESTDSSRFDIFIMVPFESLEFKNLAGGYSAEYRIAVTIRNGANAVVRSLEDSRKLYTKDYENTRGAQGDLDYVQFSVSLAPNIRYKADVVVFDVFGKAEGKRSHVALTPNALPDAFTSSTIMFMSSLEERDTRYVGTPHLSSNVARLAEGFYAFVEVFNPGAKKIVSVGYEIKKQDEVLDTGKVVTRTLESGRNQVYMRVQPPVTLASGSYTIQVSVFDDPKGTRAGSRSLLKVERDMNVERTLAGLVMRDLDKSIRQLRWVATQAELEFVQQGASIEDRKTRFEDFWKKVDPTPLTLRNEAFEDYYSRVEFANRNFRSYNEGWLTDMGMVYVIFGQPLQIDRQPRRADGRMVVRWVYQNNFQILFADNSGFDDFRLLSPLPAGSRYQYNP